MMRMEKGMLEELLLVCSCVGTKVAGSEEDSASQIEEFVRSEDCLMWLQDLQRALRRDESVERAVRVTLGSWGVLRTKLLPLANSCVSDAAEFRTLAKVFVLLTLPLEASSREALATVQQQAGTFKKKAEEMNKVEEEDLDEDGGTFVSPAVRKRRLRDSAAEQVRQLCDARLAFAENGRVLRALLVYLRAPLEKAAQRRTKVDDCDAELVLTLLRNLVTPLPRVDESTDLRAKDSLEVLIAALSKELVLDVVADMAASVRLPQNEVWNLILVEIIAPICSSQLVADVAEASITQLFEEKADEEEEEENRRRKRAAEVSNSALGAALRRESATKRKVEVGTRHSRFGSVLRVADSQNNTATFCGGTNALSVDLLKEGKVTQEHRHQKKSVFTQAQTLRAQKIKKKKHDDTGKPCFEDDVDEEDFDEDAPRKAANDDVLRLTVTPRLGPAADRAKRALARLTLQLESLGAGELVSSVKNELRRDSAKLVARDKHLLFCLTEYLLAFRRERASRLASRLARVAKRAECRRDFATNCGFLDEEDDDAELLVGLKEENFFPKSTARLLDVFAFKTTCEDIERSIEEKKTLHVERSASLYREMLKAIEALRDGDRDSRKVRARLSLAKKQDSNPLELISAGMLSRLLEGADPMDPLPKLIRAWKPRTHTKRHACELAEIVHTTTKLLEHEPAAYLEYMRKIATMGPCMEIYGAFLETYRENTDVTNHHVYSFLTRLASTPLFEEARCSKTPTSAALETMEPLLYRVKYFVSFAAILGEKNKKFASLAQLSSSTLRHFKSHAAKNPLLYVEALFCSSSAAGGRKWCGRLANNYADDFLTTASKKKKKKLSADEEDEAKFEREIGKEDNWDDENEVDFGDNTDLAASDKQAAERRKVVLAEKKKNATWTLAEDMSLARIIALAFERGFEVDYDALSRSTAIKPHHRPVRMLKTRVAKLMKLCDDDDPTNLVETLKTKSAQLLAVKKKKRKSPASPVELLMDLESDEEEADDGESSADEVEVAPPAPLEEEVVDGRWSDKRVMPKAAPLNKLKKKRKSADEEEEELIEEDDMEEEAPEPPLEEEEAGAPPAASPPAAAEEEEVAAPQSKKKKRAAVDDDEED